jgi:PAS domain S-box-containing protein
MCERRQLLDSRERLREAHDVARLSNWIWDPRTDTLDATVGLGKDGGSEPEELVTFEQLLEVVSPTERANLEAGLQSLLEGAAGFVVRSSVALPNTEVIRVETRGRPVHDETGAVVAVRGTTQDVSDQRRAELELERTRDFYQQTLDSLVAQVAVLDEHGEILSTNAAWQRFAAENGGHGIEVGANYLAVCDSVAAGDPHAADVAAALRQILAGERREHSTEYPCHGPDAERWFVLRATRYGGPGATRIVVQRDNVTERHRAEHDARIRARLLDEVAAAVIATDEDGRVEHWNDGAHKLHGWTREEAVGRHVAELVQGPADRPKLAAMIAATRRDGRWQGVVETRNKDGGSVPASIHLSVIHDECGQPSGFVGVGVDVSEQLQIQRELRSARDYLRAITDSMGEGVITTDIDGHLTYMNAAAEQLLGWTSAELAGRDMHESLHYRRRDGSPFPADECPLQRACHDGGVVRVDDDAFIRRDGSQLSVAYTSAPFQTPEGIRGMVVVFGDITERKAQQARLEHELEALSWLGRIRTAFDEARFVLHAQPIIDLTSGETVQHELLIRMLDIDGSLVPPGLFLPAAEAYGLIREIDRWVISEAARLAGNGHAVEINLSARSLGDRDLFAYVSRELADAGADPSLVVFEITETGLLENEASAQAFVEQVKRLGCQVALDDFGTGYGGFTYLKRLPVDYLKIDVEFVRDLPHNEASQHVVRAVVNLAKGFGQKTVAEGVEDSETLELLRELDVDLAQGYGLGRPAPIDQTFKPDEMTRGLTHPMVASAAAGS